MSEAYSGCCYGGLKDYRIAGHHIGRHMFGDLFIKCREQLLHRGRVLQLLKRSTGDILISPIFELFGEVFWLGLQDRF